MTDPTRKHEQAITGSSRAVLYLSTVRTLGMLLTAFGVLSGCGSEAGKQAELTEQEIANFGYRAKPSRPDELIVSGEVITCEDVMAPPLGQAASATPTFRERLVELARVTTLTEFMDLTRPQVRLRLNENMSSIILFRRAERTLGGDIGKTLDAAADKALRQFVLDHGGNDAEADEALKARGLTRTAFKEGWKRQELANYAYVSALPRNRPMTYSELAAAYDQMKDTYFVEPGLIQFRLIDIQPAKMIDSNDEPVYAARALAESLVTRIVAGEDFAELAQEYSHGFRAELGGLWTPRDPEALAEPYTILAGAAEKIRPGQIAGPLDAPGHCFIMKLELKREKGYRPLADVQEQVERQVTANRNAEALAELEAEVSREIAIADTDRFVDYCLERLYRLANESATGQ